MQGDRVAFGVLDEGDEAVFPDGEFLFHHLATILRGATGFHGAIEAGEIDDCAASAGILPDIFTSAPG